MATLRQARLWNPQLDQPALSLATWRMPELQLIQGPLAHAKIPDLRLKTLHGKTTSGTLKPRPGWNMHDNASGI